MRNVLVGNPIEIFYEAPEAIAVGGNQRRTALHQQRLNALLPIGEHPGHGIFQALGQRQMPMGYLGISRVVAGKAFVGFLERGRTDRIAAASDVELLCANLALHLIPLAPLQRAVMALVEPPTALNGKPGQSQPVQHDLERFDGAL